MKTLTSHHIILYIILLLLCQEYYAQSQNISEQKSIIVNNLNEFNTTLPEILPGDTIKIASGIWKDIELKFEAHGEPDKLIYIIAEKKGSVFFEGESNIKMGGKHLHLEGLVFRNGYTPTSSVISLQKDKSTPCNNCRVTECVIDNYNPPERFDTNYWIEIYGKNNRFDHNYLVGKRNRGVTLAVRMKNEQDRENHHIIDYNYFGYHPILGSNGGETLRLGTSHYSLSNANTVVENNYFERCNGELEIISSKSCQNTFRNNTFYECQGTLTMRHGNETQVENNYFIGNRKANTGGIRLINEKQTVRNNYLQGLTGSRFKGALVIMNGVPNSPLNRYYQVKDSDMSNNFVIDCDHIQLCAGSDQERSATPVNTSFSNNIIYNKNKNDVFTIYDDVSGISFKNNVLSPNIDTPSFDGKTIIGFESKQLEFISKNDLVTIKGIKGIGVESKQPQPNVNNTGVTWYPKKDYRIHFKSGKKIPVDPGENTLYDAMKIAENGDILVLKDGSYHTTRTIFINKTISIIADAETPILTFERSPLISLENEGSLELENLQISGKESDDYSGNSVIRTSRYSMIDNYKLMVRNCNISNLDVNHSFNFLKIFKNTFADSILLEDCVFENITGHVLNLDKEIDDSGIYNVENCIIDNCTFRNIGGSALKLYRGGRDESTFGPMLWLTNSSFTNVGYDKRNKNEAAIHLFGVQYAQLENITMVDSRKIHLHMIVGEPVIQFRDIQMKNTESLYSNSDAYLSENVKIKP